MWNGAGDMENSPTPLDSFENGVEIEQVCLEELEIFSRIVEFLQMGMFLIIYSVREKTGRLIWVID